MAMKSLRIGTIGSSTVMDVMQEAIRLTDGVTCSVIYSRTRERAEEYALKQGVDKICWDFEEFLSRDDVDAVYIASPNSVHTAQACAVMKAGKHVIIEKPMTLTREEVDLLHRTAVDNDVFIFEAITTIFMPNFIACKELLPSLGPVTEASIRYGKTSTKIDNYRKGIIPSNLDPALKGGTLNDMGIYCIHAAVDLFGAPQRIEYEPVYGPNGADIEGKLTFFYPGFTCHLEASKVRDLDSGCLVRGAAGYAETIGTLHNCLKARACIGGESFPIDLQREDENRMIYELSRFRDAILQKDTAFFMRMYQLSRTSAGVLEDAHRDFMNW